MDSHKVGAKVRIFYETAKPEAEKSVKVSLSAPWGKCFFSDIGGSRRFFGAGFVCRQERSADYPEHILCRGRCGPACLLAFGSPRNVIFYVWEHVRRLVWPFLEGIALQKDGKNAFILIKM